MACHCLSASCWMCTPRVKRDGFDVSTYSCACLAPGCPICNLEISNACRAAQSTLPQRCDLSEDVAFARTALHDDSACKCMAPTCEHCNGIVSSPGFSAGLRRTRSPSLLSGLRRARRPDVKQLFAMDREECDDDEQFGGQTSSARESGPRTAENDERTCFCMAPACAHCNEMVGSPGVSAGLRHTRSPSLLSGSPSSPSGLHQARITTKRKSDTKRPFAKAQDAWDEDELFGGQTHSACKVGSSTAGNDVMVCLCMAPTCVKCNGTDGSPDFPAGPRRSRQAGSSSAVGRKQTPPKRKSGIKRPLAMDLEEGDIGEDFEEEARSASEVVSPSAGIALSALELIGWERGSRWDFWEIFGGCCAFTKAVRERGLIAGPPVDWKPRVIRGGELVSGPSILKLDMRLPSSQTLCWQLWKEAGPKWVHFGTECTFMVSLGRKTAVRSEEEWADLATAYASMEKFTSNMLHCQTYSNEEGSYENPPKSGSWRRKRIAALCRLGFRRVVFKSCAHGLRNPATGEPWAKLAAWSSRVDLAELRRPCTCSSHDVVEGCVEHGARKGVKKSKVAGEYPPGLCAAMSEIVARHVSRHADEKRR